MIMIPTSDTISLNRLSRITSKSTIVSTRTTLNLDLSALVIFPVLENTCSTGALVAGKHRNLLLSFASDGNRDQLLCFSSISKDHY